MMAPPADAVRAALSPLLGARFLSAVPLCEQVAQVLQAYDPRRAALDDLYAALRDVIFGVLHRALGPDMLLTLDDGLRLRLRLRDIDTLADESLGVLLDALPAAALPLTALRSYAMRSGRLSPMRVMLQRYGAALPPAERDAWVRVIRENHPADRYSNWLQE